MPPTSARKKPSPIKATGHLAPKAKAMQPGGDTDEWQQAQRNQCAIGDKFLLWLKTANDELSARAGLVWNEMPEDIACSQPLYGYLATYLSSHYIIEKSRINAGQKLMARSALAVWGGLIALTQRKFSSSSTASTAVPACPILCPSRPPTCPDSARRILRSNS